MQQQNKNWINCKIMKRKYPNDNVLVGFEKGYLHAKKYNSLL